MVDRSERILVLTSWHPRALDLTVLLFLFAKIIYHHSNFYLGRNWAEGLIPLQLASSGGGEGVAI